MSRTTVEIDVSHIDEVTCPKGTGRNAFRVTAPAIEVEFVGTPDQLDQFLVRLHNARRAS